MTDILEKLQEDWLRLSRGSFDSVDCGLAANVVQEAIDEITKLRASHAHISERTDATRAALRTALGQWRMYAEMYETGGGIERDFDIEKEKSPEADMYRRCKAALSVDVVSSSPKPFVKDQAHRERIEKGE